MEKKKVLLLNKMKLSSCQVQIYSSISGKQKSSFQYKNSSKSSEVTTRPNLVFNLKHLLHF